VKRHAQSLMILLLLTGSDSLVVRRLLSHRALSTTASTALAAGWKAIKLRKIVCKGKLDNTDQKGTSIARESLNNALESSAKFMG
jgi:hypothetical protein